MDAQSFDLGMHADVAKIAATGHLPCFLLARLLHHLLRGPCGQPYGYNSGSLMAVMIRHELWFARFCRQAGVYVELTGMTE